MWFVMGDRFINMNNISSVEIVPTGKTEVKKRYQVCLRFLRNEPDQCLFQGDRGECELFVHEFISEMHSNRVFHLHNIEEGVERVKNVR